MDKKDNYEERIFSDKESRRRYRELYLKIYQKEPDMEEYARLLEKESTAGRRKDKGATLREDVRRKYRQILMSSLSREPTNEEIENAVQLWEESHGF